MIKKDFCNNILLIHFQTLMMALFSLYLINFKISMTEKNKNKYRIKLEEIKSNRKQIMTIQKLFDRKI